MLHIIIIINIVIIIIERSVTKL